MERPLLIPLVSMIAGLFFGLISPGFQLEWPVLLLLAMALCAVPCKSRLPFHLAISSLLFLASIASLKPYLHPDLPPSHIARFSSEEPLIVEGVIDSRPETTERGFRLYLRAKEVRRNGVRQTVAGRLLLSVKEGELHFVTGDRIGFASRIRIPRNYGMPGEFDMERYLAFRGVFATAHVNATDDLVFLGKSGEFALQRRIDAIALYLGRFIKASLPPTEGAIMRALLLGDMGGVPREMKDAYARTGVNHILSISGFHVGIIAFFIFQVLIFLAKRSEFLLLHLNLRRFTLALTLPVLVFYLFLSGAAPATLRSVIMIGVFILAMLLERETDPVDSLMLAAVVILAGSPCALFDISFQLSFLAFWGLVVLTPIFASPFKAIEGKMRRRLLLFFLATAAATAATIVPVAYYFHRATLTGLISNFLIVPLLGYGAVVLGFVALPFVYFAPFFAKGLLLATAFLVKLSNTAILLLAKIPALPVFSPTWLDLAILYALLMVVTFVKPDKLRRYGAFSLLFLLSVTLLAKPMPERGKLALTFFSVGQGDSALIEFPDGKKMLVDGGGSYNQGAWDVGERLLVPALWKMGIKKLDYMVLTHPHPDHCQGLVYVAANFAVGEFWEGGSYPENGEYRALRDVLRAHQVPIRTINAATAPLEIGGARIEPLAPLVRKGLTGPAEFSDMNDESLVLRITAGAYSVLLTGDIGQEIERRLIAHPERLQCNILKISHHGSRHASSVPFLKAAAPGMAVISAGYGNSFHLPSRETLDRLAALGIRIYRTDLDGTVRIVCDVTQENTAPVVFAGHFR
ncbi:MAG TPA: DNA internalization-related competence protein ComEC/Rec2 [Geobacteraceae bacterium]